MSYLKSRLGIAALVALIPLSLVGLPALAQHAGKMAGGDLQANQAKEMAALIQQGQLNLRDATALAERHVNGTALEAVCTIENGAPQLTPAEPKKPGGPSAQERPMPPTAQSGGKRLVYEVSCFANDKLQTVRVDGMTKQVMGGEHQGMQPKPAEPKTPEHKAPDYNK